MGTVVRSCVACRRRADREELVRFGVRDGRLTAVAGGPGRSAYLCRDVACYDAALRKGAFARALGGNCTIDELARRCVVGGDTRGGD